MSNRLGYTGIEFGDRSWNFYPGCRHKPMGICPVQNCWAESMSKRQRQDFHQPRLIPELLLAPLSVKKLSIILVNFMGDLFGDWVDPKKQPGALDLGGLKEEIFWTISRCPQHQFLFLTKAPSNLLKWGKFPDNAWVGVSVCNQNMFNEAVACLAGIDAKHKWLSFEPLLERIILQPPYELDGIDWVVIGGQTNPVRMPERVWVDGITDACRSTDIPYWLKNNLSCLLGNHLVQEYPKKMKE